MLMLIGIAGTETDFLLSLPVLKSYLKDVVLKQYPVTVKSEQILEDIRKENPDIVGFSCYVWNMPTVRLTCSVLNDLPQKVSIILGGPEISLDDARDGQYDVDYLVFGEGEETLCNLIEGIKSNLDSVKGIAYRKNGKFIFTEPSEPIELIDSAYLSGHTDEFLTNDTCANFESQRGCTFRCAYCFFHKGFPKIRYRNPDIVIKEIKYAFDKGIRIGRIIDANFLSNKEHAKRILNGLIDNRIEMALMFEMLPQFLDKEIAELFGTYSKMFSTNRIVIGMGIQTLNQESLEVIRRKIPVKFFERAFDLLSMDNVVIKSDVILGLPRETKQSYYQTIEFMAERMRNGNNYLSIALLQILPGSDMVQIAKDENMVLDRRNDSRFVYSTPTMPREDMLDCMYLTAMTFRLLSCVYKEESSSIKALYFDVKDSLEMSHVQLIEYLFSEFNKYSDFTVDDFPDGQTYFGKKIRDIIPDDWLIAKLIEVSNGKSK